MSRYIFETFEKNVVFLRFIVNEQEFDFLKIFKNVVINKVVFEN